MLSEFAPLPIPMFGANISIDLYSWCMQNNLKELFSGLNCIFLCSQVNDSPFQFWFHF